MFGHPLHPALVHFPIALLLSASIADAAWLAGLTSDVHLGAVMMAGGLVAGLLAMGAGTVLGYRYGLTLSELLGTQGWAWVQSLIAGTLLHVLFGRPHLHSESEDPHHEHKHPATPREAVPFEGLGSVLALLALVAIGLTHEAGGSEFSKRLLELSLESAPALLLAYVIGGLKLTPPGPTFTQARDAIFSAIGALDPRDLAEARAGFARRGMGRNAVSPASSSSSLTGVVEDFTP